MGLIQFKVEVAPTSVEGVDAVIQELGLAEWGMLEDLEARRAWIVGVFQNADAAGQAWRQLRLRLAEAGLSSVAEPEFRELADADWKESYKAHFKAWRFGPLHWVPVWERESYDVPAGELVLWMDPGMAFGTGNHESTRLCCERLVAFAGERGANGRVIDAGCGSGILALSAARLGFARVMAFDNDPLAVDISRENSELNGLAGRVEFRTAELAAGLAGRYADLVLANIQADVLARHARELCGAVAPGGRLVLSGILARERDSLAEVFRQAAPGWRLDSRTMGEWCDLVLEAATSADGTVRDGPGPG